jgi:hypothetical protein
MSWHIIGEAMSLVTWWGVRDRLFRRGRRPDRPLVEAPAPEAGRAGTVDGDGDGTTAAPETPASAAADA